MISDTILLCSTCCWLSCARSPQSSLSSSKTALLHTELARQSALWDGRHQLSLHQTCGSQQSSLSTVVNRGWWEMQHLCRRKFMTFIKCSMLCQAHGLKQIMINKYIGDDTKAAARQSQNCIKKKQKMAKNDFQYGGWSFYTLQCGMWLWNHDSEFTKWQHPAMWYVALGWHAIKFVQTSAILELYIWFRFRPYHRSRNVILHQSAKLNFQTGPPSAEKNDVMSIFKLANRRHLGF